MKKLKDKQGFNLTSFNLNEHFQLIVLLFLGLIVLFVAYYFLYALPHFNQQKLELEREKQEQEVRDREERQEKEEEKINEQKSLLDSCLNQAGFSQNEYWKRSCVLHKKDVDKAWKDCRSNIRSWETDETNKESCKLSTPDYKEDNNGSCALPGDVANRVEKSFKDAKDECYRKYPVSY